jgi:hypothetical protein
MASTDAAAANDVRAPRDQALNPGAAEAPIPGVDMGVGSHVLGDLDDEVLEDLETLGIVSDDENATAVPPRRLATAWAKHIKPPKQFSGDVESARAARSSVKQQLDDFWFDVIKYIQVNSIPVDARIPFVVSLLEGRAKLQYRQLYASAGDKDLTWVGLKAFLDSLCLGADEGPYACMSKWLGFSFWKAATNGPSPRSYLSVLAEFDRLMDALPDLSALTKCYQFVHAWPEKLRDKIRYDMEGSCARDWVDFPRLKAHALGFAQAFDELVAAEFRGGRQVSDRDAKRYKPAGGSGGGSGQGAGSGAGSGSGSGSGSGTRPEARRPAGSAPGARALSVPEHLRSMTHQPGFRYFIKGMTADRSAALRKQGKCMLCQRSGHMLAECGAREKMFGKGTFFYYPADAA